jgi:hypothetical protein
MVSINQLCCRRRIAPTVLLLAQHRAVLHGVLVNRFERSRVPSSVNQGGNG